ncbi:drug resistance transporter, Bcr/CflA subfamily [Desulfosporosinus orientis DSM 765]|uniref:Bcr/CflA family efflux transporter n=1 Tax=Desulfosporosinus orientis (strain ATCC 19365 / DSM 765 / NCIMB 8382 / VKM B-1628 / Singapore I) TaxID=768706 RepID=G7WDY3_DESOD|nr:Bcr/CflA family efflux MFS transporter [Desulfosporosinus orientis]AET69381.1 drug resistance transporter, Bcr/CflA subfamily [Desulfosporosinus orientis DSM 765]
MISNMDETAVKLKTQKYLGEKGLIVLVAFLSAFIPLSTDLYLPALPRMAATFQAAPSLINLTLIMFFIFYAAGSLFWGPLSDKYGRKPILLIGLVIYTAASALCAFAGNVYLLILFRIFQAIASGAATSVAQAIVKDSYSGEKRVSVLAVVTSMAMISPIVAPVVGAIILSFTSWRGVFLFLAVIGLVVIAAVIAMEETIDGLSTAGVLESLGRLGVVAKNPGFMSLLLTFSLMGIPMMSFISSSSYIYVNQFGLSEQVYSYFFAANAFFMVIGPLLYMRSTRLIKPIKLISLSFFVACISGLLISTIGVSSPWMFGLSLIPATLAGSITRPPSANLMLEQQKGDTGAVVSLMSFAFTVFGSIGMIIISLDWADRVKVMGILYFIFAAASLISWSLLSKKAFVQKVLH